VFCIKVSFITDDDEFNRDDELDDEFTAGKKLLSPASDFSARLSDAETFKGVSRQSSVSADDDDEEGKDAVYFMPSTDAEPDRWDLFSLCPACSAASLPHHQLDVE